MLGVATENDSTVLGIPFKIRRHVHKGPEGSATVDVVDFVYLSTLLATTWLIKSVIMRLCFTTP
jgi:hypothetical protein